MGDNNDDIPSHVIPLTIISPIFGMILFYCFFCTPKWMIRLCRRCHGREDEGSDNESSIWAAYHTTRV